MVSILLLCYLSLQMMMERMNKDDLIVMIENKNLERGIKIL